jgi:hypothetical protein
VKPNFKSTKFVIACLVMIMILLVMLVAHYCTYGSEVVLSAFGLLGTICVSFHIAKTKEQKLENEAVKDAQRT